MSTRQEIAMAYIQKHKIPTLMENLLTKLVFHQPESPSTFLVAELRNLIKLRRDPGMEADCLFTLDNVAALYDRYDINNTGVITAKQYTDAFLTLNLPLLVTPPVHCPKAQFLDDVTSALKLKESAFY